MEGHSRHYLTTANTGRGFYNFFDTVIDNLEALYILKGVSGNGKSTLLKKIGSHMQSRGYDIQYIHCPFDVDSLDGIVIDSLKIGIVDGTYPHIIEPKIPALVGEYVNMGAACDGEKLRPYKKDIIQLKDQFSEHFNGLYDTMAEALAIHDKLEALYVQHLDISAANKLGCDLIERIFAGKNSDNQPTTQHLFFDTLTTHGHVDFVENLTEQITKRFLIKGRAGSGKSTLLKKLVTTAEENGFHVEAYHCAFDPESLDMVVIPELGVAALDSTSPHEYFPERDGDEVIDTYDLLIEPGTDEKYQDRIKEISEELEAKWDEAKAHMIKAHEAHDDLEALYKSAIDFEKVTQIQHDIQKKIDHFINPEKPLHTRSSLFNPRTLT